jgi:hypothetical protein
MRAEIYAKAALAVSIAGLVFSMVGPGRADTAVVERAAGPTPHAGSAKKPHAAPKKKPDAKAKATTRQSAKLVCEPLTVDLGTYCMDRSPQPVPPADQGQNNYFYASQACTAAGGWLPSAAELIGAAKLVPLESTIHDSTATATVDEEPANGLKDQREMSSTLVTTAAGSNAAGSEGVSEGSTGNPQIGEPNPVPAPAIPSPQTLQYVTVYSNGTKGGFAGSEPVGQAENFRCAYAKTLATPAKKNGKGETPSVIDEG